MRKNYCVLMVLFVSSILIFQIGCQEQAKAEKASPVESQKVVSGDVQKDANTPKAEAAKKDSGGARIDGPAIEFEKVLHDFGKISPGKQYEGEFTFKNTGNEDLKIGKIDKSCGCTAAYVEDPNKFYSHGESGKVKVVFNSPAVRGITEKNITVHSNAKNNPEAVLAIRADVEPKVAVEPETLNLLLKKENAGCPPIKIKSLDGKEFAIVNIKATNDAVTADFNSNQKAKEFIVNPKVNMEKLKTTLAGRIYFWLNHPECDQVSISFEVLPEYTATPSKLFLFNAQPGKAISRTIHLMNNYGEDFKIESTSSEKNTITVKSIEKVAEKYRLLVDIIPPAQEGNSRIFRDTFYIHIAGGSKYKIDVEGIYSRPTPQ